MATRGRFDIIFLVKSLNCGIGGMETHQNAFIRFFSRCNKVKNFFILEQHKTGICVYTFFNNTSSLVGVYVTVGGAIMSVRDLLSHDVLVFANDFWWIENLEIFRQLCPCAKIMIRSGGNDIELAPWNLGEYTFTERLQKCVKAVNSCDYVIANSDFSVDRLIAKGVKEEKIISVRGGVDSLYSRSLASRKDEIRADIVYRHQITLPKIGIFSCRLVPFKGIELAIEALCISSVKDVAHIIFVGDGPIKESTQSLCIRKNIQATFIGAQPNEKAVRYVAGSDFLINTSIEYDAEFKGHKYIHTETMGRSMMEAIMVNTPIIATNVGGTSQLFKENKNIGILCDCNSLAIASAMERICYYPKIYTKEFPQYGWNFVFNTYITLFEKSLQKL